MQQQNQNGTAGASGLPSSQLQKVCVSGPTVNCDVDGEEDEEEEDALENLTTSGDPLLGRQPERSGTGFMANHVGFPSPKPRTTPWQQQKTTKPVITSAKLPYTSIPRGLDGSGGTGRGPGAKVRPKVSSKKSEMQGKQRGDLWRSEIELLSTALSSSQRLDMHSQNVAGKDRAKLSK